MIVWCMNGTSHIPEVPKLLGFGVFWRPLTDADVLINGGAVSPSHSTCVAGWLTQPPSIVMFVWACLADKPWLKVLLADLV